MRVLVLGATGMLGHKVVQVFSDAEQVEVLYTSRKGPLDTPTRARFAGTVSVDRSIDPIRRLLQKERPDWVINALGIVKQHDAMTSLDEYFHVNGELPHLLAYTVGEVGGRLLHVSTDCVFDGERGAYTEKDAPDASDAYGRSKAVGEVAYDKHTTLRTSIVGFERRGFVGLLSWFLAQPDGATINGYTNARYSGLPTIVLARMLLDLMRSGRLPAGLWNVASEPISKYELLMRIRDTLPRKVAIHPCAEPRHDRTLDDTAFRQNTGTVRPGWAELVTELAVDYRAGNYDQGYRALRGAGRQ